MNDELFAQQFTTTYHNETNALRYIETPRTDHRLERIDTILEKRMREFLLARRQRQWQETGE